MLTLLDTLCTQKLKMIHRFHFREMTDIFVTLDTLFVRLDESNNTIKKHLNYFALVLFFSIYSFVFFNIKKNPLDILA